MAVRSSSNSLVAATLLLTRCLWPGLCLKLLGTDPFPFAAAHRQSLLKGGRATRSSLLRKAAVYAELASSNNMIGLRGYFQANVEPAVD